MKTKLTLVAMLALAVAIPAYADLKIGVLVPDSGPGGLFGPSWGDPGRLLGCLGASGNWEDNDAETFRKLQGNQ